jgi:hypothetical protein
MPEAEALLMADEEEGAVESFVAVSAAAAALNDRLRRIVASTHPVIVPLNKIKRARKANRLVSRSPP